MTTAIQELERLFPEMCLESLEELYQWALGVGRIICHNALLVEREMTVDTMLEMAPFIIAGEHFHGMLRAGATPEQARYLLAIFTEAFRLELRELGAQRGQIGHACHTPVNSFDVALRQLRLERPSRSRPIPTT
jgi:hypothetical protein